MMTNRAFPLLLLVLLFTAHIAGLFLGWNMAMTSLHTRCLPMPGETLVSVHQKDGELVCTFASEIMGPRAIKRRSAS